MSKLSASQRSAIRAGAQDFARRADLDVNVEDCEFSDLASLKADARRAARDLADKVQSLPESRAAETEAAQAAILDLVDLCDQEMDCRSARGDRSPTSRINPATAAPREARESRVYGADGEIVSGGEPVERSYSLRPQQRMSTWAAARKPDDGITPGAFLRAIVTGAKSETEQRALAGGTDAAGGFTVPTVTSAQLIDLARANMVLDAAGAQTMPLDSAENVVAKVTADPTPAWRVENAAVNEGAPTFGGVILKPKSIAVMVKASVELMSDSVNLEAELPNVLAKAMAQEIDRAGLIGSGTDPEPTGIVNYSGLTSNLYAGGALAGYGPLMTARRALHGANERLGAFVLASRDENDLAALTASDGQPLNMPQALQGVPMLHTSAIPTDGGAGSDASQIIAGDFSQLLIGVRSEVRVEVLRERFMDNLQFGLIAHARIDFAAARESAFTVLDGVTG